MAYHRDVSPLALELMGKIARREPEIVVTDTDMVEKLDERERRFLTHAAEKQGYAGERYDYGRELRLTLGAP